MGKSPKWKKIEYNIVYLLYIHIVLYFYKNNIFLWGYRGLHSFDMCIKPQASYTPGL